MSEASRDLDTLVEQNILGPDYFGYYVREVEDLLLKTEDFLPFTSRTFDLATRTCGIIRKKDITQRDCAREGGNVVTAGSLFHDAVGAEISDYKAESLKVLLRQSVVALAPEVDEMLDPVIAIRRIHSRLRYKMSLSSCQAATFDGDAELHSQKKRKLASSLSSIGHASPVSRCHIGEGRGVKNIDVATAEKAIINGVEKKCSKCLTTETSKRNRGSDGLKSLCDECEIKLREGKYSLSIKDQKRDLLLGSDMVADKEEGEVNDDLQFLLESDSSKVEKTMKKYSDELSKTLGRMEEKLEKLLDTVMLACRLMTRAEKKQLRKLIQKLPPRNLDHIIEILQRNKPSENHSSDEICVNLENQDNATLWRLYYYVETVENARKLSCVA